MARRVSSDLVARFASAFERISGTFSSAVTFPHDLSLSKLEILALEVLSRQEEMKTTALAKALGVRFSTVTGIVDRLVGKQLVTRTRNHGDRRVVRLRLTDQGKATASGYRVRLRAVFRRMTGVLSAEERQTVVAIMEKVAEGLEPRQAHSAGQS